MQKLKILFVAASVGCCLVASSQGFKPYRVGSRFGEVANRKKFDSLVTLNQAQRAMLQKNLFVVTPTNDLQLYWVYGVNDYQALPSIVTADTVLHLYHVFYDATLRGVEQEFLIPKLKRLTSNMLNESLIQYNQAATPALKAAATRNAAYFAVAQHLLDVPVSQKLPQDAVQMVKAELRRTSAASGYFPSAIFPYKVDYSQFIVRGHYTRTENLKRYFRAMTWFGLLPISLSDRTGNPVEGQLLQSVLMARALKKGSNTVDWNAIYEPTAMFVGTSNMLTPAEVDRVATQVFGSGDPSPRRYALFVQRLKNLRTANIQAVTLDPISPSSEVQLRFMGRRYIPDSEMLQKVTDDQRNMPSGLDVMAILGSARAAQILDGSPAEYNPKHWAGYLPARAKMKAKFAKVESATWTSNLYWSWLNALRPLLTPASTNYPSFMQTQAWTDKNLNTALASWTQLRHDTILYGEQSAAEMGDGDEEEPFLPGFVEPQTEVYQRLLALSKKTRQELQKRGMIGRDALESFKSYEELLDFLRTISTKEMAGKNLSKDEHQRIRKIEREMEDLTIVMLKYGTNIQTLKDDDLDMALVADVHTGGAEVLEEAVGHADRLIAIVPIEGKLYFARGSVFSWYEFKQPMSERMTDESWKQRLASGKAPQRPAWTKSFFLPTKLQEKE
jgi:hypothetical protein